MPLLCRPCDRVVTLCLCVGGCVRECVGCVWGVRVARVGVCVRVCAVVDPDGGFQGVWRVCVCHSCTCDMRDTCTTATGISQESEDADSARRERAAQKVSRGENARHSTPQIPTGEKSATFATRGEIGDFLGGPKSATFATLANRRLLSRGEKGARRLF